jgi:hypothetical protein
LNAERGCGFIWRQFLLPQFLRPDLSLSSATDFLVAVLEHPQERCSPMSKPLARTSLSVPQSHRTFHTLILPGAIPENASTR